MNYKQGISREQISRMSFECHIGSDNPVRVLDMFVEQLDLGKFGFTKTRATERSEYQDAVDENNKRTDENMPVYKIRQQITEHPFGTIKRSWGYTCTLVKGIEKVNGGMSIIFTMYNIRRAMSILGVSELISRLKQW